MDTIITYDEVTKLLAEAPNCNPRPNFENIRTLKRFLIKKLRTLLCPQSAIMGWSGMVMDPVLYSLVEPTPFMLPADPGNTASYPHHRNLPRTEQANIDATFERQKNYFLSYINIYRAIFNVLDTKIDDAFKVGTTPGQTWTSAMSITDILTQLTNTYGKPNASILFVNNATFSQQYDPRDPPEMLFKRLEECQEVAILGDQPYTAVQLLNTATHLLETCGHYTLEFQQWDAKPPAEKTYANLKTFIQEAYTGRLNRGGNTTSAQAGFTTINYVEDDDDTVATLTEHVASLAATSQHNTETANSNVQQINAALQHLQQQQQQLRAPITRMGTFGSASRMQCRARV